MHKIIIDICLNIASYSLKVTFLIRIYDFANWIYNETSNRKNIFHVKDVFPVIVLWVWNTNLDQAYFSII